MLSSDEALDGRRSEAGSRRMMVRALRCRLSTEDGRVEIAAWTGAPSDLASAVFAGAYLVPDEALESLSACDGLINDRGRKHPSRPLASLLIRRAGVPIVRAAYRSTRQLVRSIRTLLERAARAGERKAYVIAVPVEVFDEASVQAGADFQPQADPVSRVELDPLLIDAEDVPVALERHLVGTSQEMQRVRQLVMRATRHDEPVLVLGETGTGKEVVARSIHLFTASRRRQPFIAVNCSAIPRDLFESELFGYAAGAFTNALPGGSDGLWRAAQGGTIFLDEIGDLAPANQAKLLRVLEQKAVRPVGATREVAVDARVVAATNRELRAMVQTGEFREDLYYRLAAMFIPLPRLKDRPEDIPALAAHFWREVAPKRPALPEPVLQELIRYRWQGNARELRHIMVNLHTTFPRMAPTVQHLQAVMRKRLPPERTAREDPAEEALRRIDCLRHLRRAGAAIDGCRRVIEALGAGRLDVARMNGLRGDLGACLTELQLLGARPDRFPVPATFEATHRLSGAVALLVSLLVRNRPEAVRYCRSEVVRHVKAAAAAIRREEERMLRAL